MSSTNRGGTRHPQDFYGTPIWTTHRLLDRWWPFPAGKRFRVLDPCAGDGAIFRAITTHPKWDPVSYRKVEFHANELRVACVPRLKRLVHGRLDPAARGEVSHADFLHDILPRDDYDLVLTNPPFSKAVEFRETALEVAPVVTLLLRLNFLSSRVRHDLFQSHMPIHTRILPNRPCFALNDDGIPGSDSTEYAWMTWDRAPCPAGQISILDLTPPSVISAARADLVAAAKATRKKRA